MNRTLLPFVAASLLVALPAQDQATQALQRAQLLEQQEGDLATAQQAYRGLLADASASSVHGEAALRLGTLLWRLEQREAATPLLQQAVAAGGDVAARANAVLQGQDAEGKQQAELLAKAEALVKRIVELAPMVPPTEKERQRLDGVVGELRLLGPIAAQATVLDLERRRQREVKLNAEGRTDRAIDVLLPVVWQVGGPHAIDALTRWSKDADVNWRRRIAQALETRSEFAADLQQILKVYLADSDPAGEVARSLTGAVGRLPLDELVLLAKSTNPAWQRAGLTTLRWKLFGLPEPRRQTTVDELADTLVRATHATDPTVAQAAWGLLVEFAFKGPANGQILLCAQIERVPACAQRHDWIANPGGDDGWIQALADAATRLGPRRESQTVDSRTLVAEMVNRHQPLWTKAGVESALRLVELGYASGAPNGPQPSAWLQRLVQLADKSQAARLIENLPNLPVPSLVLRDLYSCSVDATAFPPIRDFVQRSRGAAAPDWMPERGEPNDALVHLLHLAAKSRHPEAAAWLFAQLDRAQPMANLVANALRSMSSSGDESARAQLRKVLVWPGNSHDQLKAEDRSQVLAELVRAGDVETIDLLPRAHELGLRTTRLSYVGSRLGENVHAAGIGFLLDPAAEVTNGGVRWHGYADKDLLRAWRIVLSSPSSSELAWLELAAAAGTRTTTQSSATDRIGEPSLRRAPAVVLPQILELLPGWWTRQDAASKSQSGVAWSLNHWIQSMLHRLPDAELREEGVIEAALRKGVQADDPTLARWMFCFLPTQLRGRFVDEARTLIASDPEPWFVRHVCATSIPLREQDWRRLLQSTNAEVRTLGLTFLPPESAAGLRDTVFGALRAESPPVRNEAILAAARVFGDEAVPALLPLLQDQDENVRKLVREQLEKLRQDAEQRTFWQKAQAGIDTSSQGAAAKLLLQAKAGEPKEQRLLALRSLAVLGVAETLPYLIDAANEADADIAAAARAAITAIHQKGGAPAERPAAEPTRSK